MAGISGIKGKVSVGGDLAEITGWTFNPTSNNPSWASVTNDGYKTRVAGAKDGTGSCQGKYDPGNSVITTLGVGKKVTMLLYIDDTRSYSVPAIIDSFEIEVDADDGEAVGWSCDFSTRGKWTDPT